MTVKIGPKEAALKVMREEGRPKRKRDPMKIGKMSPSMAKALEIVERKKKRK